MTDSLIEKIIDDIAEQAKKVMAIKKIKFNEGLDNREIILQYLNSINKFVEMHTCQVKYSSELLNKIEKTIST